MTNQILEPGGAAVRLLHRRVRHLLSCLLVLVLSVSGAANAQEVNYSWLDLSFMAQDVGLMGTQVPVPGQTVDISTTDGDGVRFRGSFGTWHNMYMFVDYGATDIDIAAVVTNDQGVFLAEDEFDLTTIRGGVGVRFPIGFSTDINLEVSYDSLDFDFGSFAGEDFDISNQDVGGTLGIRSMVTDNLELRAYGRYSSHADLDLNTLEFDTGASYGAGFGWEIVRGLSIVGDYEAGAFDNWSLGFRLGLDED